MSACSLATLNSANVGFQQLREGFGSGQIPRRFRFQRSFVGIFLGLGQQLWALESPDQAPPAVVTTVTKGPCLHNEAGNTVGQTATCACVARRQGACDSEDCGGGARSHARSNRPAWAEPRNLAGSFSFGWLPVKRLPAQQRQAGARHWRTCCQCWRGQAGCRGKLSGLLLRVQDPIPTTPGDHLAVSQGKVAGLLLFFVVRVPSFFFNKFATGSLGGIFRMVQPFLSKEPFEVLRRGHPV